MVRRLLGRACVASVAVAAAILGGVYANAAPPPEDGGTFQPQIIGGHDATETYSFMVSLSNGCGGSLVTADWLVTADHCGSASSGRIGSIYKSSGGEVRNIDRRITKSGTDLTVMHLTQSSTKTPIPLATSNPAVGGPIRLIGFGCTSWPSCSNPS